MEFRAPRERRHETKAHESYGDFQEMMPIRNIHCVDTWFINLGAGSRLHYTRTPPTTQQKTPVKPFNLALSR